LKKKTIETSEDIELQLQLFAYNVAKHYNISLTEVYNMSEDVFRQSLAWALAFDSITKKEQEKQRVMANTESNDVVTLDYSFLEQEDF
jgi:hypothetical protein